jgi:hypothetical protein
MQQSGSLHRIVFASAHIQKWAACVIALERPSATTDQVDDQDDYRNHQQ